MNGSLETVDTAAWLAAVLVLLIGWKLRPTPPVRTITDELEPDPGDEPAVANDRAASTARPRVSLPHRRRSREGGLARWCDDLARAVRGGSTLHAALRNAPASESAPVDARVRDIVQQLNRGRSLAESVRNTTPQTPGSTPGAADAQLVFTVLQQCAAAGGSSAEPLERAAAVLRGRDAARGDIAAQSASARMSAVVLTLLPLGMLLLLLATSSATRSALMSPPGVAITSIGLGLNLAGWRWMQRLVNEVR